MVITPTPPKHACITREAYYQAIEDMRNQAVTPGEKLEKFKKLEKQAGECPECDKRIGSLRFWKNTASWNH